MMAGSKATKSVNEGRMLTTANLVLSLSIVAAIVQLLYWLAICPGAYAPEQQNPAMVGACGELYALSGIPIAVMVLVWVGGRLFFDSKKLDVGKKKRIGWMMGFALVALMLSAICSPSDIRIMNGVLIVVTVFAAALYEAAMHLRGRMGVRWSNVWLMIIGGVLALSVLFGLCVLGMKESEKSANERKMKELERQQEMMEWRQGEEEDHGE